MHAGMCQRVHIFHHKRRFVWLFSVAYLGSPIFWVPSIVWELTLRFLLLASEKCQQEKRKTVNGEDILFAMTSLGFENYAEALKIYLSKYREVSTVWISYYLSPLFRLSP